MSTQQPTSQPDVNSHKHEKDEDKQPVLESASATTSQDNRSGVAAYVIVAVVLMVLVALALTLCNVLEVVGTSIDWEDPNTYSFDDDDYDDLLDDLGIDDEHDISSGQSLTADNALDQYLGCIEYTVSDYVFASDYSGSQQAVATYVKALASRDASSAAEVKSHLRAAAAAGDDATRASELQAAGAAPWSCPQRAASPVPRPQTSSKTSPTPATTPSPAGTRLPRSSTWLRTPAATRPASSPTSMTRPPRSPT